MQRELASYQIFEKSKASKIKVGGNVLHGQVACYKHMPACTWTCTTQPPFLYVKAWNRAWRKRREREKGPVAEAQTDRTTQKKTDSVAFPITVSGFDMNQRGTVVASISNPDLSFPTSFFQSSVK